MEQTRRAFLLDLALAAGGIGGTGGKPLRPPSLTCGFPLWATPPVTHARHLAGHTAAVKVGLSADMGGVGVLFGLINRKRPEEMVNIQEARSAAGSGWQTSHLFTDAVSDRILVFNQASGNSLASQWGYDTGYTGPNGPETASLAATGWNPLPSDHYHPHRDFGHSVGTSPCRGDSLLFEDGRLLLTMERVPTPHGEAIRLTNLWRMRSRGTQHWASWFVEQAFYLNKAVARRNDLRVYLCGADGWREGPIRPYDDYAIVHATGSCTADGCAWAIRPLRYVVLIYHIAGLDLGIAIDYPQPFRAHLNMAKAGISGPDHSDACGSIDWHTVIPTPAGPIVYAPGQEREYLARYHVGDLTQLASLGYTVAVSP